MKRNIFIFIPIFFILLGCEKKAKNIIESDLSITVEETKSIKKNLKTSNGYEIIELSSPLIKFVKTDDGSKLNYREDPVDGHKVGQFYNDTKLEITKKTNEKITIDGINDYWYYAINREEASAGEGWVFGGYLSENEPIKKYLKKEEINLDLFINNWEDESNIIYIRSDGTFRHGFKESEGFNGKWTLLDDGTLYIAECQIYDEDPWNTNYKVKVCTQNNLTLVSENGWIYDLHPLTSQY